MINQKERKGRFFSCDCHGSTFSTTFSNLCASSNACSHGFYATGGQDLEDRAYLNEHYCIDEHLMTPEQLVRRGDHVLTLNYRLDLRLTPSSFHGVSTLPYLSPHLSSLDYLQGSTLPRCPPLLRLPRSMNTVFHLMSSPFITM